jgi:Family of unknown function (DUF5372)
VSAPIRITHPFHPDHGQELEFVTRRPNWGEDRVFYRSKLGHIASIPARWTSAVPEDPNAVVRGGRVCFSVEELIELAVLVSRLRA